MIVEIMRNLHDKYPSAKHIKAVRTTLHISPLAGLLAPLWGSTSFTLKPYAMPEITLCISFNKDNSYIIQCGDVYEVYYQNELYFTLESMEYLNPDIPVYQKDSGN